MTKNNEKTNYKSYSLYTDILASYKYWTDTSGKYQTATGKVIVGIAKTDDRSKLTFAKNGSIVDADAAKIASASIKNGQITVTAKSQSGTVYLWVMDTGDAGAYTCCPVTVKMAPTALYTYQIPNAVYGTTAKYTKASVDVSDAVDVYVYPTYKEKKDVKKTEDATYTAVVEDKAKDYFTVTKSATDPYKFTVRAVRLKDNKQVSGKIIIQCAQNGKKVNFTATAVNGVKKVGFANPSGITLDSATDTIKISASKTAKVSGSAALQLEKVSSSYATTDSPKIYVMGTPDGYDAAKFAAGTVSIKNIPSTAQKKITVSISSDKKSVTVSAAKGASAGITTYFLLVYNTTDTAEKKGYKVFSVTTE